MDGRNSMNAQDLYFLMREYRKVIDEDKLYDEDLPLLESCGYDLDLASAGQLAKDVATLASEHARTLIGDLLKNEARRNLLVVHMAGPSSDGLDPTAEAQKYLSTFIAGLRGNFSQNLSAV